MRRLLFGLAAGLVLVSAAAGAPTKEPTLYGLLYQSGPDPLTRLDPGTLRPVGRPLAVGAFNAAWTYSPDRGRLALAWSYTATLGRPAAIRVVDLRSWRVRPVIRLPGRVGQARALTWSAGRLLLLLDRGRESELVAIDVASSRVVASRVVVDSIVRVAVGGGRLALLLAPRDAIGPARLMVADTALTTTAIAVDRITVGSHWDRGATDAPRGRARTPGLVVDPTWATAFVLSADEAPAAVDLRTRSVTYGSVRALTRASKEIEGPWRFGLWAGGGRMVFGGVDHVGRAVSRIGLSLVDSRTWTPTVLDAAATTASVSGGLILTWDAWPGLDRALGLRAFTTEGHPTWTALAGSAIGHVQVAGTRALVRLSGTTAKVVDLRNGQVVGTLHSSIPELLVGRAASC